MLVRPPRAFVDAGLAAPGEVWTLHRAVYGLRVSPKAWGLERDSKLREVIWTAAPDAQQTSQSGTAQYRLEQSKTDSQVWFIKKLGDDKLLGLMIVYVETRMCLTCGVLREF